MSKTRALVFSGIFILLATFLMGSIYAYGDITYSYSDKGTTDIIKKIEVKNIKVLNTIETDRVDGPNVVDNDLLLDIDLKPYETYSFKYDVVNSTEFDYEFTKNLITCLNDEDANNYLTVNVGYENGKSIRDKDLLPKGTQKTIVVSISYDKNVEDMKQFIFKFDMMFNVK